MKDECKIDRRGKDGRHGPQGGRMATEVRAATLTGHENDRETIVPLGSDGLDRRRADAGLSGEQFIEAAYPLDIRIKACAIDYPAVAYNVIDDD